MLFTDIVGSTGLAASLGDRRWRSLLDAHDEAVREQFRRFRGTEINTTGDGFMASFDGPARAIACAKAIAEATEKLGVQLRLGMHTGECEVRGNDLGGLAVHIAARVRALAVAGEILVSGMVRDLVAGPVSSSRTTVSTNSTAYPARGSCSLFRSEAIPRRAPSHLLGSDPEAPTLGHASTLTMLRWSACGVIPGLRSSECESKSVVLRSGPLGRS